MACEASFSARPCRRNSTFAILPQQLEILKVLEDPSMAVVAVALQHCLTDPVVI